MTEDELLRAAYIEQAREMHSWPAGSQPERDRHGRFEASWIEWEFMIFKAGYKLAQRKIILRITLQTQPSTITL